MSEYSKFPPQQLPLSKKGKEWRKAHLDWADSAQTINSHPVRKSVRHKRINYDLINGILHMDDLNEVLNPFHTEASYIPETIEHFPIMNSKLNVLRGEEYNRIFEYRVIVTNPNAISEKENQKKEELLQKVQYSLMQEAQSEEEFQEEMQKLGEYYSYDWQDMREVRANALLRHYSKEYNFPLMFNSGFVDAMAVGEEMYQCDIVSGEPVIHKLNPKNVIIYRSGYSNKVEDADVIILEDYWNPGKIIDVFYDKLSEKERKELENYSPSKESNFTDENGFIDERKGFVHKSQIVESEDGIFYFDPYSNDFSDSSPYDNSGNIRVIRMYWKSRRKIKKVKSYDENGNEVFNLYTEKYVLREDMGEEEEVFYVNEAWEGTKIGKDIYVDIRPRPVQFNKLSNPSKCHFGIIGTIYNINDNKAYSLVDMMKKYNYMYDIIYDRLNKTIEKNWGKMITLDLAKKPSKWNVEKWLYFAKTNNLMVIDSFNEGMHGAATGKLAGGLNNATTGVADAELGNTIQQYTNLLAFIKQEMSEVVGITPQREGAINNRETVGGVERSVMQSSAITEWIFAMHDDVKRRAIEAFIEVSKIALKGRNKKFQYILPDNSIQIVEIDGDQFAEADYGLVVDNSRGTQELAQQLGTIAQAALQNRAITMSSLIKFYCSDSLAEKTKIIERGEQEMAQREQQQQEQQMQLQQQQMQQQAEFEQAKMQQEDMINQRDNETKILVANINAESKANSIVPEESYSEKDRDKLNETIRQFDETMRLNRERLSFEKDKARVDAEIKRESIRKRNISK